MSFEKNYRDDYMEEDFERDFIEEEYMEEEYESKRCCHDKIVPHTHEFEESVKLAEEGDDRHNHRLAGVTGDAIPIHGGKNHVHKINEYTDTFDHFHQISLLTGPALYIPGTKKHIHLISGYTTIVENHRHPFLFTSQIDAPLI